MRLQEQLNVVQGSNAELRTQVKELRKELQKKDNILQGLAINRDHNIKLTADEFESDNITKYVSEIQNLQTAYQNEAEEWGKQKESLIIQSDELKSTINMLESKLNIYEENWKILELGDNEVQKAFAEQSKKYAACTNEILNINKKNAILQELVDKETAKLYLHDKEATKKIFDLKKAVVDSDKREKTLESKLSMLQSNLVNSRSNVEFNELKEKYEQLNVRFRNMLEHNLSIVHDNTVELLRHELEMEKQGKQLLIQQFHKKDSTNDDDMAIQLKEAVANQLIEKQRADHISRVHEMCKAQSANFEIRIKELTNTITELREQISEMHKGLFMELELHDLKHVHTDKICELQDENTILKVENENLKQTLLISQEEVKVQYNVNSLKLLELDSLRHQILDLQAISEDKAIISRLDFELMRTKVSEVELNAQKVELESEVSHLRREVEKLRNKCDELQECINESQKIYVNRCRTYVNVITFLQCQYAGYASTSTLERIVNISMKLQEDRSKLQSAMEEAKQCQVDVKLQQELLCNRLQIVENLMDILEQQIGGINVQTLMQHFSDNSQHMVADFKNKRKIAHLEYELEVANSKCTVYDLTIVAMEQEVIDAQKAWRQQQEYLARSDMQSYDQKPELVEKRSILIQATTETNSTTMQTDPYICCLNEKANTKTNGKGNGEQGEKEKGNGEQGEKEQGKEEMVSLTHFDENNRGVLSGNTEDVMDKDECSPNETVQKSKASNETLETAKHTLTNTSNSLVTVNDQLNQALKLASDRSAALMKYELQVTEYRVKVDALNKAIEEKDLQLAQKGKELEYYKTQSQMGPIDSSDKLVLKSSINSLQKIVDQKENTIQRYQNLLKEDRDEHNRAISGLQEEIKNLHMRFLLMQNDGKQHHEQSDVNLEANKSKVEKVGHAPTEKVQNNNTSKDDEVARLHENVCTLEADLTMMKDLSDRWHRLAEERLSHMDHMREKLEQQHKDELESYRSELNRWQSEAHMLRKQLSDNRMMLTKGNISLMKELQERDDKIHELSLTCQQLQNEVDIGRLQYTTPMQRDSDMKLQDVSHSLSREHLQHSNSDLGQRQLYAYIEKEKMYKHEIAQLKRQLSHRYMAAKAQDKKISQREMQLDRKVKSLEEELLKAKSQLDREFLAQEIKRAKTAEELSLWEKQKKWQQSAEKLKEKLKDKAEECAKLQTNYEKLRSVVSCLEREKWYLKSKLKAENVNVGEALSTRTMSNLQQNVSEVLEKECQVLRERVKELTDALKKKDDSEELLLIIEEQKRRIGALEIVTQGNSYVVDQLQRLELSTSMVERANLKLESENLELRLELEKLCSETPRLREKIEHLEKYVDLLKIEKGSDSTPRLSDKELHEIGVRKTTVEMEKTIFTLKRIVEKLQGENKRLKTNTKKDHLLINQGKIPYSDNEQILHRHYEEAQKRVIALETDLQLAEQRIIMLEKSQGEYENTESRVLKEQLIHKSELLDKVKQLLSRAAVNEKTLRQRVQQLESRQTLSTIPECCVSLPTPE